LSVFKGMRGSIDKLPLFNKIALLGFTHFFAIPNKVLVNNQMNKFLLFFVSLTCLLLIIYVDPFLYCFYVVYIFLVFESWLFAVTYETLPAFTKKVNQLLFNVSTIESSITNEYFSFFWGNMRKASIDTEKAIATAGATVVQRNAEQAQVEEKAHNAIMRKMEADRNKNDPRPSEEYEEYHRQKEEEAVDNTFVLRAERDANKLVGSKKPECS